MGEPTLSAEDREALTTWVFTFTEAEVISDPSFRIIEQIVREHVEQARADERERVARDERATGWDRAHTMLCPNAPCREHHNPWQRRSGRQQ